MSQQSSCNCREEASRPLAFEHTRVVTHSARRLVRRATLDLPRTSKTSGDGGAKCHSIAPSAISGSEPSLKSSIKLGLSSKQGPGTANVPVAGLKSENRSHQEKIWVSRKVIRPRHATLPCLSRERHASSTPSPKSTDYFNNAPLGLTHMSRLQTLLLSSGASPQENSQASTSFHQ